MLREINNPKSSWYIERGGIRKIISACIQAIVDDVGWIWIDTVCIDKSSSAELQEAINSMYGWYERSRICYAFLDDVSCSATVGTSETELETVLSLSEWQTRSWTLQEFLAPDRVDFYNCNDTWSYLGSKYATSTRTKELELENSKLITRHATFSRLTGVPLAAVEKETPLREYSIAQRFSWAAKRKATRSEDRAYSLMGLFDVNIPMLYGEGPKAFRRLQQEILNQSRDHSILVWDGAQTGATWDRSIFAPSVDCFADSGQIVDLRTHRAPVQLTNAGLRISLPYVAVESSRSSPYSRRCLALLDCRFEDDITKTIALSLSKIYPDTEEEVVLDSQSSQRTYTVVETDLASREQLEWRDFVIVEKRFYLSERRERLQISTTTDHGLWLWLVPNVEGPEAVLEGLRPKACWRNLGTTLTSAAPLEKASAEILTGNQERISFQMLYPSLGLQTTVTIAFESEDGGAILIEEFSASSPNDTVADETPRPIDAGLWQIMPVYASKIVPGTEWILHVLIRYQEMLNEDVTIIHVCTTRRDEEMEEDVQKSRRKPMDAGARALRSLLEQLPVEKSAQAHDVYVHDSESDW
ncbi:Vegetative incompatibility protein HET-E-1 [Cyphellophora attinorum]|uniref:Vegetative incompatibility protein HET-E-1 n=1 Tax=Cyphellophora attinorum TaxID=1664694 RepID=A0A0N1HB87_9EURO|nr:Vegetative incompatibility protein HET-E-1 [Phialophora attinorum]KPI40375.1 Vegetative incompatibility protein HET-E-1 [Phialophora attinorum]